MTCKLPVRDLDSGETVLITRQTRQVSDKRACTDCEPKREGGKENSGVPLLFRKWKTGTGGKETKQTKEKEEKKRKKKKKTLHVIAGVCCVTAALYFVNEECVRTNLQPLLMAKWLVTDRW